MKITVIGFAVWMHLFVSPAFAQGPQSQMERNGFGTPAEFTDFVDEAAFQDSLAAVIKRELETRYSGGEDASKVFNTNLDWHSSVHAHWALLRLNRVTSRFQKLAELVETRLTPENIEHELGRIQSSRDFEFPYGRAWFLKLAVEFEQWAEESGVDDRARLKGMADYIAGDLLARMEEKSVLSVGTQEYANPAWALTQLYHYYSFYENSEGIEKVLGLVQKHFIDEPKGVVGFEADLSSGQFFSRYGNWLYLITQTQSDEVLMEFLRKYPISDMALAAPTSNALRVSGLVWSRAWALSALIRRLNDIGVDTEKYESSYAAHYAKGVEFHEKLKDNTSYAHWVSQFAIYATTEGKRSMAWQLARAY